MVSGISIVSHRSIVGGNGRTKFTRHLMTICKVENMLNFIVFVVWIFWNVDALLSNVNLCAI